MQKRTTIVPIASGKGGVGKSLFAANLSIALANLGHTTIAVDLDLGGANLHTYLGLSNDYPGIGDYLKVGKKRFSDLLVETGMPNLKFLPGDGRTPFLANISYEQRHLLLQNIKNLKARFIILDIGAGSEFAALNFFGLAHKGVIITTFDTASIMNFIIFLKNFLFRIISSIVHSNDPIFKMINTIFKQPKKERPLTAMYLINRIAEIDKRLALDVQRKCSYYRPRIIFNMADHPDELHISDKIKKTLKHGLSMDVEFFGCIFFDNTVRRISKKKKVLITDFPNCITTQNIKHIAKCMTKFWDVPVNKSSMNLLDDTKNIFSRWKGEGCKMVA